MIRKATMFIALIAAVGVLTIAGTAKAEVPVNDQKCATKGATGADAQGRNCVCTDDPDGDPYTVWVCK